MKTYHVLIRECGANESRCRTVEGETVDAAIRAAWLECQEYGYGGGSCHVAVIDAATDQFLFQRPDQTLEMYPREPAIVI